MPRFLKLAICLAVVLVAVTSCVRASIEEMGRTAIRKQAAEVKDWFARFTAATDTADRDLVAAKLGDLEDPYGFGWKPDGTFYTEHYYRKHLTTSGGFWGEQRTVSACVRFETSQGSVIAGSIDCPNERPYSDKVDERVAIP